MLSVLAEYKFTSYFENEVLLKRSYLKKFCIRVIAIPLKVEVQNCNRIRFWGKVTKPENHILRVITLEDRITIHNAFHNRNFRL
jgi:hypothetical protein